MTLSKQIAKLIEEKGHSHGNYAWGNGCNITSSDLEQWAKQIEKEYALVPLDTIEQSKFAINDRINQTHHQLNYASQKHTKDQFGREYTKEHIDSGYKLLKKLEGHYSILDQAMIATQTETKGD